MVLTVHQHIIKGISVPKFLDVGVTSCCKLHFLIAVW